MSAGRRLLIVIWVTIYAVFHTGIMASALVWAPTTMDLNIQIQTPHIVLHFPPGQISTINIPFINVGNIDLINADFYLQSILPTPTQNYPLTLPYQYHWTEPTKTLSYPNITSGLNEGEFVFHLPITTPNQTGRYRIYLQPVFNEIPINNLIKVDLIIGATNHIIPVTSVKHIDVSLQQQKLTLFEGPFQLIQFTTSTGREDTPTPPGHYTINKKMVDVLSNTIQMQLPYWMELRDLNGGYEGYGIHGLPYVFASKNYQEGKTYYGQYYYTDGKLYIDPKLLGQPMSQGCVVLAVKDAEIVFDWTEPDKTLVNIQ